MGGMVEGHFGLDGRVVGNIIIITIKLKDLALYEIYSKFSDKIQFMSNLISK